MISLLVFHIEITNIFYHSTTIYICVFFSRGGNDFCSDYIEEKGIISKSEIISFLMQSFSAVMNFIFCDRLCIPFALSCHQIHETFNLVPFSRQLLK